jgi:hypothetical protein
VTIESSLGHGTTVFAQIPCDQPAGLLISSALS